MKNQTNKTEEKTFTVNEVGAIIERLDDKISILTENMEIKFEVVNGKLDNIENRLDGVENRLDGVENRLDLVEAKIDRLQDDMVEVKYELKKKVDVEDFKRLEKRVVKLEKVSFSH